MGQKPAQNGCCDYLTKDRGGNLCQVIFLVSSIARPYLRCDIVKKIAIIDAPKKP